MGKGRPLPLRLGDFDLRFFPAHVLEMGWVVSCAVGELKGWRGRRSARAAAEVLDWEEVERLVVEICGVRGEGGRGWERGGWERGKGQAGSVAEGSVFRVVVGLRSCGFGRWL